MTAGPGIGGRIAAAFSMNDAVWERHANPISVWTRVASGAAPFVAIWSHTWVGWPIALVLLLASAIWLWINPRAFPPPASTDNWASKVVLGERVWLNREDMPIPAGHALAAKLLSAVSALGALGALAGGIVANGWALALGLTAMYFGKLWFCDRMVWLYDEMKEKSPTYRSWLH